MADPPAASNQYATGAAQLRTTAQWLVGAFGALGAALIAGIQLKNLTGVSGTPLTESIISVAVGLVGVAIAIWSTSDVLIPIAASSGALRHGREFGPVRKLVEGDDSLLRGLAGDLPELLAASPTSLTAAQAAYESMRAAPQDPGRRDAYNAAEERREQIESTIGDLIDFGLFLAVRRRFVIARVVMFAGAALATAGAIGFVHFAQAGKPKPAQTMPVAHHVATVRVVSIRLTSRGARALRHRLGRRCRLLKLTAVVVGGAKRSPRVVTLPRSGCVATTLQLTPGLGQMLP